MNKFNFYFKYAARSILRDGQRTFFAVLCVAVGVSALVAMLSLSTSIRETLTGDIQSQAGGDITASTNFTDKQQALPQETRALLERYKNEGRISEWTSLSANTVQFKGSFGFPPALYTVDPAKFPLYGKVEMVEPNGGDFRKLLAQPNSIIVGKYLWDKNEYKLGQEIEVTTSSLGGDSATNSSKVAKFKIVGMVRSGVPGVPLDNGLFFGFAIISEASAASLLDAPTTSGRDIAIYLKTSPTTDNQALKSRLENESQAGNPSGDENITYNPLHSIQTATERQEQVKKILPVIDKAFSYIGLLAILIGGIGVVNTMLVVIGRRTTEIATIKALGLKNRQVLTIFTLEAMILGVLGSLLGLVLGLLIGFAIKGVAEGLFLRPLNWGFYPQPLIAGFLVGILTSGVFGFLPAYSAARVRPAVVLRQASGALPRLGGWVTAGLIILMTLALGLIAGVLVSDMALGILGSYITLLTCLFLAALFYVVVFLTGKLPAPFGPSFKMAVRSFSRNRGRTAVTLLIITVGLFFMTFITVLADSMKVTLRQAFDLNLGYNVVALNLLNNNVEQIQNQLQSEVPGVQNVFAGNQIGGTLLTVNGQTAMPQATAPATPARGPRATRISTNLTISGRSLVKGESLSPNGTQTIIAGRNFTAADMSKPYLLVRELEATQWGLKPGDKLEVSVFGSRFGSSRPNTIDTSKPLVFEVLGIFRSGSSNVQVESPWVAPFRVVADAGVNFSIFYMMVDRAQIKAALNKTQSLVLGGFVLDISELVDTFTRILDQFLAFPLLLSLLSLFSGAILIANNVALSVLERRTEIGVLKAIGAKRRRVFNILLWESGFIGLLGGLLGVGVGILIAFATPILLNARDDFQVYWSPLSAGLLLLLGIGLAIAATLVSAWGAVQEKPLVVLRYE